jgi:hypothetical protein
MIRILVFISLITFCLTPGNTQGVAFGLKGGPTMAFQKWDSSEREALFAYHMIASVESLAEEGEVSIFAQAGYHNRGSAIRIRRFQFNDITTGAPRTFNGRTTKYDFQNVALSIGVKQRFSAAVGNLYYLFGLRGEYNLNNSLDQFLDLPLSVQSGFPSEPGVNDFTFGFIFGGGFELPLSDFIDATIELTINPDFTKQYVQPAFSGAFNPFTGNNDRNIPELNIRNNSIELTIGFRFKRVVEYVD